MKKNGCTYNGGQCHPVVASCAGCSNVEEFSAGNFCRIFAEPALKWNAVSCNMASHIMAERAEEAAAKKVNPLKASKRAAR
jgi:hypothetical protein